MSRKSGWTIRARASPSQAAWRGSITGAVEGDAGRVRVGQRDLGPADLHPGHVQRRALDVVGRAGVERDLGPGVRVLRRLEPDDRRRGRRPDDDRCPRFVPRLAREADPDAIVRGSVPALDLRRHVAERERLLLLAVVADRPLAGDVVRLELARVERLPLLVALGCGSSMTTGLALPSSRRNRTASATTGPLVPAFVTSTCCSSVAKRKAVLRSQ